MVYFYLFCFIPVIIHVFFRVFAVFISLSVFMLKVSKIHLYASLLLTCIISQTLVIILPANASWLVLAMSSPISIFAYKVSSQTSINNQSILVVELTTPAYCTKSSDNNFLEIQSFDFLILFAGLQFSLFSLWHLSVKFCFLWYMAPQKPSPSPR